MAKEIVRKEVCETAENVESKYTVDEFAKNAVGLFGVSHDIADAALTYNGVNECTVDEARKIIKAFAERKVK